MKPIQKKSKAKKEAAIDEIDNIEIDEAVAEDSETNEFTSKIKQLENELEKQKALNAELSDKVQRNLAEFDNFRKRTAKEKASMFDDGVRETVLNLLPIVDNFERALKASENKDDAFYKGVEMIYNQIISAFDSMDIKIIEAEGKEFDPNYHAAVAHIESEDFGVNTVAAELLKGYIHKDKVIRHSMVQVAN